MEHLNEKAFNALADGRLTPSERHRLQSHLDGCDRCRREMEFWTRLSGEMDSLVGPGPRSWQGWWRGRRLNRRILTHLFPGYSPVAAPSLALGAMAVGILLGIFMGNLSLPLLQPPADPEGWVAAIHSTGIVDGWMMGGQ